MLRGHGSTEVWGQTGPPRPHTATRADRAGLQPGATTDANHCGAATGLGGECPGKVIVPEITVAVCKSKKVVFHPGPASGSTHWAYTESSQGADQTHPSLTSTKSNRGWGQHFQAVLAALLQVPKEDPAPPAPQPTGLTPLAAAPRQEPPHSRLCQRDLNGAAGCPCPRQGPHGGSGREVAVVCWQLTALIHLPL